MTGHQGLLRSGPLVSAFLLLTTPLAATTFVMVPDEDLADQAAAVVEARVMTVEAAPGDGIPATDYLIEVERVVKGSVPGSNLIVRVPGGVRADGLALEIRGAPRFVVGERALLMLQPGAGGTFRVLHLMLGAFHRARLGGATVLVRDLSEVREVPVPGLPANARVRYRRPRDRERFIAWLADRALGQTRSADYFVAAPQGGLTNRTEGFSFFTGADGLKFRWFDFDDGGGVPWRVHRDGQPPFTLDQTVGAFRNAQRAWNKDRATIIDYRYAGTTTATGGFSHFDGVNAILFGDPAGLLSPYRCNSGGVLAAGGPWTLSISQRHHGEDFHPIIGGDIITNDGIACFFTRSPSPAKAAEELFGHELGHTLGLRHSCDDPSRPCDHQALMNAFIHNDGRGARLTADDRAAIFYLYGLPPPAAPSGFAAEVLSQTEVRLTWSDNSDDETGFIVERSEGSGGFSTVQSLPADSVETTVGDLVPGATYDFRVRAVNFGGYSSPSDVVTVTMVPPAPAAPSGLTATSASPTSIALAWTDNSAGETGFVIEHASPLNDFHEVATTGPDVTAFTVTALTPSLPSSFRVRARNAVGDSAPSNEASATPVPGLPSTCAAAADTLCLTAGGRFQVRVQWRNQHLAGDHGIGEAEPFSGSVKTGRFWFFDPANVELIVKVLDAGPVNGRFWVFYGALSDVEYWLTVVDTATGAERTYHNPPGEICGVPDTDAFPSAAPFRSPPAGAAGAASTASSPAPAASGEPCQADATTLCLEGGRFEVRVTWTDERTAASGVGTPLPGSDRTGYFWFFNPQNIELVVKMLDARSLPGNSFWLFYGALSDVHYTITVRDTATGLVKPYLNPQGDFCGLGDTEGFPDSL